MTSHLYQLDNNTKHSVVQFHFLYTIVAFTIKNIDIIELKQRWGLKTFQLDFKYLQTCLVCEFMVVFIIFSSGKYLHKYWYPWQQGANYRLWLCPEDRECEEYNGQDIRLFRSRSVSTDTYARGQKHGFSPNGKIRCILMFSVSEVPAREKSPP